MYAVFKSGGKQHRVKQGDVINLELIEAEPGSLLEFNEVLLVANGENITVGLPYVVGSAVTAEVIEHGRGDKIKIVKFRRRKHHRKQMGHRHWHTQVKITEIKIAA